MLGDYELEEKYLTEENMWVLNLPTWLEKPVFTVVHFFCKVKYTVDYLKFLWKGNYMFDLDYIELLDLMDFKMGRMQKQMNFIGNTKASKEIEQTRMYLEQHDNAEDYVTVPEKFAGKTVSDLFSVEMDGDNIQLNSKLSQEETDDYSNYLLTLNDYAQESWDLYWESLKENVTNWA